MSFVYLASAYSDSTPQVMEDRYIDALRATARLTERNLTVYSPIVHYHPVAQVAYLPKHFDFWQKHNLSMLSKASALYVLASEAVHRSFGVRAEVTTAQMLGLPVFLVSAPHFVPTEFKEF